MYTVVILDIQKADIVIDFPVLYKPKHLKSNLNSIVPCVRNPKGFLQCPSKNPQTFSTLILTILKVSRNKTLMCKKSVKERLESRKYYQLRSQPIVLAILYIVPKKKKKTGFSVKSCIVYIQHILPGYQILAFCCFLALL